MTIATKPKLFSEPYILNRIKSFQCYILNFTISILVLSVLLESTVKIKQEWRKTSAKGLGLDTNLGPGIWLPAQTTEQNWCLESNFDELWS